MCSQQPGTYVCQRWPHRGAARWPHGGEQQRSSKSSQPQQEHCRRCCNKQPAGTPHCCPCVCAPSTVLDRAHTYSTSTSTAPRTQGWHQAWHASSQHLPARQLVVHAACKSQPWLPGVVDPASLGPRPRSHTCLSRQSSPHQKLSPHCHSYAMHVPMPFLSLPACYHQEVPASQTIHTPSISDVSLTRSVLSQNTTSHLKIVTATKPHPAQLSTSSCCSTSCLETPLYMPRTTTAHLALAGAAYAEGALPGLAGGSAASSSARAAGDARMRRTMSSASALCSAPFRSCTSSASAVSSSCSAASGWPSLYSVRPSSTRCTSTRGPSCAAVR
mmetsp:Transcript_17044/g.42692  ORF Transcript_17044/g.42692 Transcript_17044/m.42692 type:complete len:330 (+) Transcript_17044:1077-2066(+)